MTATNPMPQAPGHLTNDASIQPFAVSDHTHRP
jgi:hypothetical protein